MLERFEAAKKAGFDGAEVLFPYDLAAKEVAAACHGAGLHFIMLNTPPPNWAGGPRGFAAVPGDEDRFRRDFDRALRFAQALGAQHLHVMAGKADGPVARRTYVENLKWACKRAPHSSLLIEPINQVDMPGYFLSSYDLAAEIIDEVGVSNLGLLFDAYHAHLITEDIVVAWDAIHPYVRHVQIAGAPGRHEPRVGEIDYAEFFQRVDATGYRGWVSAEYVPQTTTEAGLRWMRG